MKANGNMVDLHTHSVFSDGTDTPEELIKKAQAMGLRAIALCDHNSVNGLPRFLAAAQGSAVHAVAGVEFSTEYSGMELHILGLFLPQQSYEKVTEITDAFHAAKKASNFQLVQRLAEKGYAISWEELTSRAQGGYINRAHIGALLTEKGCTQSIQQAFQTVLGEKHGLYVPPNRPSAFAIIEEIREMHAVPVLAHPFLSLDETALCVFLDRAVDHGLLGMETYYPLYDPKKTALSMEIAEKYNLAQSGGSDYHGKNKPHIAMGTGMDNLQIDDTIYQRLLEISKTM